MPGFVSSAVLRENGDVHSTLLTVVFDNIKVEKIVLKKKNHIILMLILTQNSARIKGIKN